MLGPLGLHLTGQSLNARPSGIGATEAGGPRRLPLMLPSAVGSGLLPDERLFASIWRRLAPATRAIVANLYDVAQGVRGTAAEGSFLQNIQNATVTGGAVGGRAPILA